jgi:hypothetical protein
MKKSKFTEAQIAFVLQQAEDGVDLHLAVTGFINFKWLLGKQ